MRLSASVTKSFLGMMAIGSAVSQATPSIAENRQAPASKWVQKLPTRPDMTKLSYHPSPALTGQSAGSGMITQEQARKALSGKTFVHHDGYPPKGVQSGLQFYFEGPDGIISKKVTLGYNMFGDLKKPFTITVEDRFKAYVNGSFELAGWGVCKTYSGPVLVENKCRWTLNYDANQKMYQFGAGQFTGYSKAS